MIDESLRTTYLNLFEEYDNEFYIKIKHLLDNMVSHMCDICYTESKCIFENDIYMCGNCFQCDNVYV